MSNLKDFEIRDGVLKHYWGHDENVSVPAGVVTIGENAFWNNKDVKNIIFPDSVKNIKADAFWGCDKLVSVKMPEFLEVIESNAFRCCENLVSITIPSGVKSIQAAAFSGCSRLISVELPEGLESIEYCAFEECKKLERINIPESVTEIGEAAFNGCLSLADFNGMIIVANILFGYYGNGKVVTVPEGVIRIDNGAFHDCETITDITLPKSLLHLGEKAFIRCVALKNIIIPEGITKIEFGTFWVDKNLRKVVIPSSVKIIDTMAFDGCSELVTVELSEGLEVIRSGAFDGCTKLKNIIIPDSVTEIEDGAFRNCTSLANEDGLIIINNITFDYCGDEEKVVVPDGTKSIGAETFHNCKNIKEIILPNSLLSIGKSAFSDCSALKSIKIPDSVVSIGEKAFYNCLALRSIEIPKGITSIAESAFCNCENLNQIDILGDIGVIESCAFNRCSELSEIELPKSLVKIGEYAFAYCNLSHIEIPSNIESIEQGAFQCDSLIEVTFYDLEKMNIDPKAFPINAKFILPKDYMRTKEKRDNLFSEHYSPIDAEEYAYIWLYQVGKKWKERLSKSSFNPNSILESFAVILSDSKKIPNSKVKEIIDFIERYASSLEIKALNSFVEEINKIDPTSADAIKGTDIFSSIVGKEVGESPIEQLVLECMNNQTEYRDKAVAAANKGIRYADGSGISSKEAIIAILEPYIEKWYQNSKIVRGTMSEMRQISRIPAFEFPQEAEKIANALNKQELSDLLEGLINGKSYREYVLAYARFATGDSITRTIAKIRISKKGKAKEKYWAENLEGALYLSDTQEAAEYIEKDRDLSFLSYVRMRGYESETDYRDTVMLSDFGFDADGIKRYDIGGTIIEVSLDGNLAPVIYDAKAKKALSSFPKKSAEPEKAAACAAEYAQLKKDIKDFFKKRAEYMRQLYMKNERIAFEVWSNVYCKHPLLKHLTEMVIWQDEKEVEFMVRDGKCFDVKGEEYIPDTKISPVHVLDMTKQDIRDWQNYLAQNKTKLLIDQVWEPVVKVDGDMRNRYSGYVITAKDRNALKKELKDKGIDVHAERHGSEFNPYSGQYEFDPDADMILGSSAKLHYVVDEKSGDLTLGTLSIYKKRGGKRELNAVIHALDKASVKAGIAADRVELLTKDFLSNFTAAQIVDFIAFAAEKKSSNCTAILLEYKNEHFASFEATDEFTLDF